MSITFSGYIGVINMFLPDTVLNRIICVYFICVSGGGGKLESMNYNFDQLWGLAKIERVKF